MRVMTLFYIEEKEGIIYLALFVARRSGVQASLGQLNKALNPLKPKGSTVVMIVVMIFNS